ncbi:hypothetical protein [Streptomyces chartreusis]|uniref:hypothetical protein n=1 Tax=Streptomyces chartreusis TaxID=1969 RepID=UPI00123D393A|nr:hypothetical protein [Streptomyces chartreusis]GGW98719.1 hypothetical protein GCM10010321_11410 [Streptomyces chartreusis]
MQAIATTKVTILRGTEEDEFGDERDTDTPIATGIPASLVEQTRRVSGRENPTPRTVRYAVARVPAGTDITDNDRVLDERTGDKYIVDAVSGMANPAIQVDRRVDLRRTT